MKYINNPANKIAPVIAIHLKKRIIRNNEKIIDKIKNRNKAKDIYFPKIIFVELTGFVNNKIIVFHSISLYKSWLPINNDITSQKNSIIQSQKSNKTFHSQTRDNEDMKYIAPNKIREKKEIR